MRNEDAFIGISLLAFDVERVHTEEVHSVKLVLCTPAKSMASVSAPTPYPSFLFCFGGFIVFS